MQHITTLLQKIKDLAESRHESAIEIDLMMDYTRQLYVALLESKSIATKSTTAIASNSMPSGANLQVQPQPDTPPAYEQNKPYTIELSIPQPQYMPVTETKPVEQHDEEEKDIRMFIGINDKYQIISELFGNKKAEYDWMIDQLNTLNTELDALTWLQDNLYFEYSWSEDSEALMILHGILHQFYSKR